MKATNHKNNKKKVNNAARDKRRKEARNRRNQAWHDPIINTFGVQVQNYQGMFLSRGTETGKAPVKVKWIDINKGDEEKEDLRSRLVAMEFNRGKRPDLFAPPHRQ